MNKKIFLIPLLCSVTCLTGCAALLSSLTSNSVSRPSFSNEGDETSSDKFASALQEDMEDAGVTYLANSSHYQSLVGSYKIGIEESTTFKDSKGTTKASTSSTSKRTASINYDRDKEVIVYENKVNMTAKESEPGESKEESESYTYKGHYQLKDGTMVTTDDVVKTYEDTYVPASIESDYRFDYIIYSNIGSLANVVLSYTSSTYKEYCKFYRNGKTYTVKYSREMEDESSYSKTVRTYEEKVQLIFDGNKMTLKIDDRSTMTDTYSSTTTAHMKNDKRIYSYDTYGTASVEFKTPSKVSAVNLDGYDYVG